ncbi:MAG TPA: hypothetical protein VF281_00690 [Candidatus Saccharimonadales bacterium]
MRAANRFSGMIITEFALTNPNVFTGFEQTRVIDLITVLAFASLVIWAMILLSMTIRRIAIMRAALHVRRQNRRRVIRRRLGAGDGL